MLETRRPHCIGAVVQGHDRGQYGGMSAQRGRVSLPRHQTILVHATGQRHQMVSVSIVQPGVWTTGACGRVLRSHGTPYRRKNSSRWKNGRRAG